MGFEQLFPLLGGLGFGFAIIAGFIAARKGSDAKEWEDRATRLRNENERLLRERREAENKAMTGMSVDDAVAMDAPTTQGAMPVQALMDARAEVEETQNRLQQALERVQDATRRADEAAARAEAANTRARELEEANHELSVTNTELREQVSHLQAQFEEGQANPHMPPSFPVETNEPIALSPLPLGVPNVADVTVDHAELQSLREQVTTREIEITKIRAELDTLIAERDAMRQQFEQQEQEQDIRFNNLQEFAENQVGKLMKENRELRARLETVSLSSTIGGDGAPERLMTLATLAPFGVFEANAEGKWQFVNAAWTRISGLTTESSAGDGWRKAIYEADRAGVEAAWSVMLSTGSTFSRTFRLTNTENQIRWTAMRAGLVNIADSRYVIGVVEDITDRRRAEESARSSAICLRSVVDASMESIVFLDRRGDITSWNRSAERIFGYGQEEALGRSLMALLVPDDQATLRRALARAAQTDQLHTSQVIEGLALCKNGTTLPVEISVAAWRAGEFGEEDADIRYTATIRDISERRRAEDFRRDKEAAEEANRAKSQFLANMSHELRTPLNAIIGFSEILHDRTFGDLTPKQERYVGNILSSGRHLLQLINDILDLSKVEAGHVQLEYVAFPVAVAIRNVEGLVKVLLQKKNLTLETEIPADLPVLIADQAKFKQILYNLVSNAVKFTPDGGRVTITAAMLDNGKTLQVAVADTGIGIKPEDQERIFREFEQVDSSYARMQQGTGLGLALVRRFVDMHRGRIRVHSEGEGKGTTFIFTIPFTPPDDEEEMVAEGEMVEAPQKPIILVVDDDQAASELLTHHLQVAGYMVSRAFTGSDALVLAREMHPSVITLDVQLPDKDGWSVLEALKADSATRHIPVLMVSIIEDRERAQALGAAECFVKPVVKERLLAAIAREIKGQQGGIVPALTESGSDTVLMNETEPQATTEALVAGTDAVPRKRASRTRGARAGAGE